MLLHCWACCLASNHPHILRVVAEFFTANSPRPRAAASLQSGISLLPSWPDGKTIHSLPHCSKFDFRSLFAFHEPTRGRVLVQLCAELVVFVDPISYRGHLIALISAFNIQVESPSQHIFRCNTVPCDHSQMSFNWLTLSTASQAQLFLWKISKWANAFSGFPRLVDGSYLKQLCVFSPAQGSHAPPSLTSARFNVITIALSTTLSCTRATYTQWRF